MAILNTAAPASWNKKYEQGTGETNWTRIQPEMVLGAIPYTLLSQNTTTTNARIVLPPGESSLPLEMYFSNSVGATAKISTGSYSISSLSTTASLISTIVNNKIFVIPFSNFLMSPDGSKLFTHTATNHRVITQYNLTTRWDISTATLVNTYTLNGSGNTYASTFSRDGKSYVYLIPGSTNDYFRLTEVFLNKPYDFSSGVFHTQTTNDKEYPDTLIQTAGDKTIAIRKNLFVIAGNDGDASDADETDSRIRSWTIMDWDITSITGNGTAYFSYNDLNDGITGNDDDDYMIRKISLINDKILVSFSSESEIATSNRIYLKEFNSNQPSSFISFDTILYNNIFNGDFYYTPGAVYVSYNNEIKQFSTTALQCSYVDLNISSLNFLSPPTFAFSINSVELTVTGLITNDKETTFSKVSSSTTQYVATGTAGAYKNSSASDSLAIEYTQNGLQRNVTLFNNTTNALKTFDYSTLTNTGNSYPGTFKHFSSDGQYVYNNYNFADVASKNLVVYKLTTPWDLSTAQVFSSADLKVLVDSISFYFVPYFSDDGTKLIVLSSASNSVSTTGSVRYSEWSLTTPWDLSTISNTYPVTASNGIIPTAIDTSGELALYDLYFNKTGTELFLVNIVTNSAIRRYSGLLPFSLLNTNTLTNTTVLDFSILTGSELQQFVNFSISGDGKNFFVLGKMYSCFAPYDFASAQFVYDFTTALPSGTTRLVKVDENLYITTGLGTTQYLIDYSYYNPFTVTESPAGTYTIQFQEPLEQTTYSVQYDTYTQLPDSISTTNSFTSPLNIIYEPESNARLIFDERQINDSKLRVNISSADINSYVSELKLNLRKSL